MKTFLFTDIEGSTRLWEEHGEVMATALARHDEILQRAVSQTGGVVLKTTGDGLIAIFDSVADALSAAVDAQGALGRETWGEIGRIRVRMGIHSGDTEVREGDHFGPVMNRAARIMAAGHGGQVLVSASAAASGHPPGGVTLRDLGMHRLKDLTEPEHLFQLVHESLQVDFPAPRTLDGRVHNLPQQATEFLGREAELAAIHLMLGSPTTRLLTITGPGGAGKTRIALQVAAEELDRFPDGVYFVDLSTELDPDGVFDTIAQVLSVPVAGNSAPLDALEARLRDSRTLLVLDNFEQVTEAAIGVSRLIQSAPRTKVVVTSRERLRVRAEKVFPVPPLSLARPQDPLSVISESEAVALFIDRARAVRPDFCVDAENAAIIAEVCLRLDGLPLAIELAAARLNVFSPADLLDRLKERLDVLGAGGRDLPDRQRTLWGAIGWSYELLNTAERDVFELLSVFSTSDLRSIEAVAADALGVGDVLDTLGSLIDKSLVRTVVIGSVQRFSMLQTIREFAASKLAANPDREEAVCVAHANYFCALSAAIGERLHTTDRQGALGQLEGDLGNLRTAWSYWVERDGAAQVIGMVEGLWALHESKGRYRAAVDLANDAIGVLDRAGSSSELAAEQLALRMSLARGMMALRGYGPEIEQAFREAMVMSEQVGTPAQRFPVLRALATYHMGTADFPTAAALGRQLLALGEEAADESMLIEGHYVYGAASAFVGDLDLGLSHLDRAIDLHQPTVHDSGRFRLGPNTGVVARTASGLIRWHCGALERAVDQIASALDVARQLGRPYTIAYALHHSALFALYRRRYEEALERAREMAVIADENEYPVWKTLATVTEGVAISHLGDPDTGLIMTEHGIELYQGLTAPPVFWSDLLRLRALSHAAAGQAGRAVDLLDEAIALVGSVGTISGSDLAVDRAHIMQRLPHPDLEAVESSYRAAAEGARKNGLRFIELRALTGLVDVRRQMPKSPDGSDELRSLYATFTEGLVEHDMVVARELLELA